jgi:hypothetical protein
VTPFAVTALILWAAPGVLGAVVAPQHTAGEGWVYDVALSSFPGGSQALRNVTLEGTIAYRVEGKEDVTAGLRTYASTAFSLSGEGTVDFSLAGANDTAYHATWTLSGTEYLEDEGLELVRAEQAWVFTTAVPNPVGSGTIGVDLLVNVTIENEILSRTWGYPYDVGDYGEVELNRSVTVEFELADSPLEPEPQTLLEDATIAVECTSRVSTTVPAGTFDTYELRREDSSTESVTVEYYSEDVRNVVRREQFNASGGLMAQQVLRSYGADAEDVAVGVPWYLWVVLLLVAITVITALVARRRRAARQAREEGPPPAGAALPAANGATGDEPPPNKEPWDRRPCDNCGHPLQPWVSFCSECGAEFR